MFNDLNNAMSTPYQHFQIQCLLILCSSLLSPLSFAGEDCHLNGESVSMYNGATTAGKTGIIRCKDSDTGKLLRDREIKAGKIYGLLRQYRDGVLVLEYTDEENGQRHGLSREYANNGKLIKEETEDHGKRKGLQREWTMEGKLKKLEWIGSSEAESASIRWTPDGAINSLRCASKPVLAPHVDDANLCGFKGKPSKLSYLHDGGQKRASETLLGGVVQESTQYDYNSGKIRSTSELKANELTETSYADNGNKRHQVVFNMTEKSRAFIRKTEFHDSGPMVKEQKFSMLEIDGRRRNIMVEETQFYLNGQIRSQDRYRFEGKDYLLDARTFSDKGKLVDVASYVVESTYSRRPFGVHQSFFESGKLASEHHYSSTGKIFRQKSWSEQGVLESDEEVFEDGSRKAYNK